MAGLREQGETGLFAGEKSCAKKKNAFGIEVGNIVFSAQGKKEAIKWEKGPAENDTPRKEKGGTHPRNTARQAAETGKKKGEKGELKKTPAGKGVSLENTSRMITTSQRKKKGMGTGKKKKKMQRKSSYDPGST